MAVQTSCAAWPGCDSPLLSSSWITWSHTRFLLVCSTGGTHVVIPGSPNRDGVVPTYAWCWGPNSGFTHASQAQCPARRSRGPPRCFSGPGLMCPRCAGPGEGPLLLWPQPAGPGKAGEQRCGRGPAWRVWALVPGGLTRSAPAGHDRWGRRVVTFSCCRLPPCHQIDHGRLLE